MEGELGTIVHRIEGKLHGSVVTRGRKKHFFAAGQTHRKASARSRVAGNLYMSAVLRDHLVRDGQSKPRAGIFCRVEWIENVFHVFWYYRRSANLPKWPVGKSSIAMKGRSSATLSLFENKKRPLRDLEPSMAYSFFFDYFTFLL
ncbi:hypothetical protein DSTSK_22010 [Desulforhabdus sp. TSK]|nr:hypothetical protein DSTSK_22010 [Desulforhabdus sp. TSK]